MKMSFARASVLGYYHYAPVFPKEGFRQARTRTDWTLTRAKGMLPGATGCD